MSPTDVPAEPSKDVQTLAPPAEKGPSSVDEGEKGGLEKTPKEEKQYRDNGSKSAQHPNRALQGERGMVKQYYKYEGYQGVD